MALLVFFIYKKSQSYVSWHGAAMVVLLLVALFIKYNLIGSIKDIGLRFDNFNITLLPTVIFTLMGAVIVSSMRYKKKKFKVFKWFFSMIILYLVFGVVQQVFFQSIVTHTLSELLDNQTLVIVLSAVFYSSIHWNWDAKRIKIGLLTLFAGSVWATLFLISPNVILLGISHAILASLYYSIAVKENVLEQRLAVGKRKTILTRIFE